MEATQDSPRSVARGGQRSDRSGPPGWGISGVAVVTGAARGNGAAIARGLGQRGAHVILADIDVDQVNEQVRLLAEEGLYVESVVVDVGDPDSVEALAAAAEPHGPIAAWVNNAGVIRRSDLLDITVAEWDYILAVNARAAFLGTQAAARRMTAGGAIVNVASISSRVALPRTAHYGAAKGAVALFTRHAALELAPRGIRVNAVAPGTIATAMTEDRLADPRQLEASIRRIPLGRVGVPEDVAGPVGFLCSAEAAYVTGAILYVDGGYTAT